MKPHFQDDAVTLWHGDCLDVLRTLPDSSVDSVVTDPPYGLEFMGKDWDGADGFRRSLNPADVGRDNAFGRTSKTSPEYRTTSKATAGMVPTGYTDGANRLERPSHLGGLNPKCRNCDHWQRGGNPCVCDAPDFPNERLPRLHDFQMWCEAWSVECLRVLKPGGYMLAFGGSRTGHRLACAIEDAGFEIRDSIAWLYGSGFPKHRAALKPAFEPIVMARKPFGTSLLVNEAKYGTGALNIDGCRVGDESTLRVKPGGAGDFPHEDDAWVPRPVTCGSDHGRWPPNVILDGSQADALDAQSGTSRSRIGKPRGAGSGDGWGMTATGAEYDDHGGASRFFPTFHYEAKAPTSERPTYQRDSEVTSWGGIRTRCTICGRQEVNVSGACVCPEPDFQPDPAMAGKVAHPTVKPLDLMRWLVRLVTPRGGTVLEPFAGSGTTARGVHPRGLPVHLDRARSRLPAAHCATDHQAATGRTRPQLWRDSMSDENLSELYGMDPNFWAADDARSELKRLHSWAGLMELLDEHWPADIFPTREDDPKRHFASRIISLLRWVDRDRAALARVEAVCASITRDRAERRVEGVADLAVKDAIDTFAEAVRDAMLDAAAVGHAQHGQNIHVRHLEGTTRDISDEIRARLDEDPGIPRSDV